MKKKYIKPKIEELLFNVNLNLLSSSNEDINIFEDDNDGISDYNDELG